MEWEALINPKSTPTPDLTHFLRGLPKAELHLHLEGTVTPETLVELSSQPGRTPLTLEAARALYNYTDFTGFLMAFKAISEQLQSPADFELITWRMLQDLAGQGVVHAEVYVSVGVVYYWRRTEFEPLFEAMERARLRAEHELGITLYWIFDAVRQFGPEPAMRVFRKAAELRLSNPSIIGIGIGGDERQTPPEVFRELYAEAAAAGLHLTCHAGETVGPQSIWGALNIGAERIGHGLTAIHDPELLEILSTRQIPVEICVSSNVRTGVCPNPHDHPAREYFDAGLMVTLNSDDPSLFGSSLLDEYRLAEDAFGFTREHLRELAANSIEASFLPPEMKLAWLDRIEQYE